MQQKQQFCKSDRLLGWITFAVTTFVPLCTLVVYALVYPELEFVTEWTNVHLERYRRLTAFTHLIFLVPLIAVQLRRHYYVGILELNLLVPMFLTISAVVLFLIYMVIGIFVGYPPDVPPGLILLIISSVFGFLWSLLWIFLPAILDFMEWLGWGEVLLRSDEDTN